jgi:PAS domain-containing protein
LESRDQISSNDIRAILDAIPALAWSVTSEGSLEFSNQAWQEYIGRAGDNWLGPRPFILTM